MSGSSMVAGSSGAKRNVSAKVSGSAMRTTCSGTRGAMALALVLALGACDKLGPAVRETTTTPTGEGTGDVDAGPPEASQAEARVDSRPPPMARPVPLWENGHVARTIDAASAEHAHLVVFDLGESWTPYLFTERGSPAEEAKPHSYRRTYLALAREEFPNDHHGARARKDKYLELYGIMPTLGVLRRRMKEARDLTCAAELDLASLREFDGFLSYQGDAEARALAAQYTPIEARVTRIATRVGAANAQAIDRAQLTPEELDVMRRYDRVGAKVRAIRAAQQRLVCEGFLRARRFTRGGIDWITRDALAEFERRHRVYGWGFVGGDTLEVLRMTPMESERESVLRILTERAMHAAGVLEDGSTSRRGEDGAVRTFRGRDGQEHEIPNLEEKIRESVIQSFGLTTPESTLAWLEGLGELTPEGLHEVAIQGPPLPEYYSGDMDLSVVIDRGDVWYDFPYDDQGQEIAQPVERRPRMTIFVTYEGQRVPLARFGTTIGGWRSEYIDGQEWWKYKESPVGPRVWTEIVAAPVWIPPESTPPRDLLDRQPGRTGRARYEVDYDEVGPSYASAYGLVAAYHKVFRTDADGQIRVLGDEGIRSHGSVDYMSIMRRHSHGCHRLHNHIAVRLMSFVLAHRPHMRIGEEPVSVSRTLEYEGFSYPFELHESGYEFRLQRPLPVNVLEGRVRGRVRAPVTIAIPKFNATAGAYLMPDGSAIVVRDGQLVPIPLPTPPVQPGAVPGTPPAAPTGAPPAPGAVFPPPASNPPAGH